MGCNVSKQVPGNATPKGYATAGTYDVNLKSQTSNDGKSPHAAREISSLKDFKITHLDFIREKSGNINKEYSLLPQAIGRGAYGEVRRALHKKTNVLRAVKIIYKDASDKEDHERLINEVNILRNLDHPNIMKIIEFYQDEKAFHIVTEFYNGGELFDKITEMKNFSEKQAAIAMKQILSAVNYCHQNNIVHRDLKPENILYESKRDDAQLKIIDFGTSKAYTHNTKMNQKFGTPYYIAPEVLKRKYTEKCDVWSCGVIMYILLCGYPPFNGDNDKIIVDKVLSGKYEFNPAEWIGISEDAIKFIKKMMEYDPNQRYSAEQALNDPWFKTMLGEANYDKPLTVSTLMNLKQFRAGRKLQEATWVFLVSNLATREEKSQLLTTFQLLDANGDGKLSREELIAGYQKILGLENAEIEVEAILNAVDNNNSGAIDYTEFVMATMNRQKLLSKERLEAVFKMFDKDGNGYLTADEIKEIFNPGDNTEVDEKVWTDLINEVDQNSDGKISYKEFKDMMLKLL